MSNFTLDLHVPDELGGNTISNLHRSLSEATDIPGDQGAMEMQVNRKRVDNSTTPLPAPGGSEPRRAPPGQALLEGIAFRRGGEAHRMAQDCHKSAFHHLAMANRYAKHNQDALSVLHREAATLHGKAAQGFIQAAGDPRNEEAMRGAMKAREAAQAHEAKYKLHMASGEHARQVPSYQGKRVYRYNQ